ncbi:MAG: hypothetical protein ABSD20_15775 [Terriglobales bacterium]
MATHISETEAAGSFPKVMELARDRGGGTGRQAVLDSVVAVATLIDSRHRFRILLFP